MITITQQGSAMGLVSTMSTIRTYMNSTSLVTLHDAAIGCFVFAFFLLILVIGEKVCIRRRDYTHGRASQYGRKRAH